MAQAVVVEHGDIVAASSGSTEAELREAIGAPPAEPTPEPNSDHEPAPESDPEPDPTPEPPRDETGKFVAKGDKPRDNPQARISQAVARQREAEAKAAALESRLAALEARSQAPQAYLTKTNGNTGGLGTQTRTKPIEDEIGTKYQTYADFAEDLADWKFEQRIGAMPKPESIAAQVRQQLDYDNLQADYLDRVEAFKATHADYDQAVHAVDHITAPPVVLDAIIRSAKAAEITYWLATHPQEFAQLVAETADLPITAASFIRRHVETLAVGTAVARTGSASPIRHSRAHPPPTPVGGGAASASDGDGEPSLEEMMTRVSKNHFGPRR